MRILVLVLCATLSMLSAPAWAQQAQPALDALLAPIALYPDDVVRLVVDAATAPAEIADAAQWTRNNRGMTAEDSVRAIQGYPWRPSVKALVAYPELLERMAESPQWTFDLGNAWIAQQADVLSTIQDLRQRAVESGTLKSDPYQTVQTTDQGIAVVPTMPYIYYVPYYDPLVVYGGWWWPAYQPVYWRPWYARPVFVTHVAVWNRGFHTFPHAFVAPHGAPPAVRFQQQQSTQFVARQQMQNRPSPAVQFQNHMAPSSFHPPVHAMPYPHAPMVQGHAMPPPRAYSPPRSMPYQPRMSSYHPPSGGSRPAGGGYHGGGYSGGGHRGRS